MRGTRRLPLLVGKAILATLPLWATMPLHAEPIRLLLLTGGHPYDQPEFHALFDSLEGVTVTHVELQDHSEVFDNVAGWPYDVVVMYNMTQELSDARMANLFRLTEWGVGMIPLHHGTLSWTVQPRVKELFGVQFPNAGPFGFHIGQQFTYNVVDPNHPVTQGMANWPAIDETYTNYYGTGVPGNRVLITTDHQPSDKELVWARQVNNSRVLCIQGGHDRLMFTNANYRDLLLRSVRWTTGQLPEEIGGTALVGTTIYREKYELPALIASLATVDETGSRMGLIAVEKRLARGAEPALLDGLVAAANDAKLSVFVRHWSLQQLAMYGNGGQLERVAPLLLEGTMANAARQAMEYAPDPRAEALMLDAFKSSSGDVRRGLAISLSTKKSQAAVVPLAALVAGADADDSAVAASALARIGGEAAGAALVKARASSTATTRGAIEEALLTWTEADPETQGRLIADLRDNAAAPAVRAAALRAWLKRPEATAADMAKALKSDDEQIRAAAIGVLPAVTNASLIGAVAERFEALAPGEQLAVLYALETRAEASARAIVHSALRSADPIVRTNAAYVAGGAGDAQTARLLIELMATAEAADRAQLSGALAAIRDAGVSALILEAAAKSEGKLRAQFIATVAQRNEPAVIDALMAYTIDSSAEVRTAAYDALGDLGDDATFDRVLQQMVVLAASADQRAANRALVAMRRRSADQDAQLGALERAASGAPDAVASLLVGTMAIGGSPAAGDMLEKLAASDREEVRLAAIRALSEWSNVAPAEALLAIARTGAKRESALAVRGYLKVLAADATLAQDKRFEMAQAVGSLLGNAEAKTQYIAVVSSTESLKAFEAILAFVDDPEAQREAILAIVTLATPLSLDHPNEIQAGLARVVDNPGLSEELRREATDSLKFLETYRERVLANWSFASGAEGWEAANQCTLTPKAGSIEVVGTGEDPFISTKVSIPEQHMLLQFRARYDEPGAFMFYYATDRAAMGQEGTFLALYPKPSNGTWVDYEVPFTPAGSITEFRFDVAVRPSTVEIDYIRLLRKTE